MKCNLLQPPARLDGASVGAWPPVVLIHLHYIHSMIKYLRDMLCFHKPADTRETNTWRVGRLISALGRRCSLIPMNSDGRHNFNSRADVQWRWSVSCGAVIHPHRRDWWHLDDLLVPAGWSCRTNLTWTSPEKERWGGSLKDSPSVNLWWSAPCWGGRSTLRLHLFSRLCFLSFKIRKQTFNMEIVQI